jgi:hypothetical protein
MSLKAMTAVWEDSQARGNDRLVLLAIADAASGDDGTGAFPAQETLAMKAGISVRTVQRCIANLMEQDELRVNRETTRQTNSYTVVVAWKRFLSAAGHAPNRDTRQIDVSEVDEAQLSADSGQKAAVGGGQTATHDKLTCVPRHDSTGGQTRQFDGGKSATDDKGDVSHTTPGGVSDPSVNRSLSSARATDVKLTPVREGGQRQGTLVPRGGSVAYDEQMRRQHRGCHPEVCSWNGTSSRFCMPSALVREYAAKLVDLKPDAAVARVVAWAREDAPPAGYVAPGSIYEHWQARWDATMASAPAARAAALQGHRVPGAAETDALLAELTAGRVRS